jgi:hypothetical protein
MKNSEGASPGVAAGGPRRVDGSEDADWKGALYGQLIPRSRHGPRFAVTLHEAHFVTDAIEPYRVNAAWIRARWW